MAVNIVDELKERLVLNGLNHVHTKSSTALDGAVEEVVLNVSSDVASMALGFSIDAGKFLLNQMLKIEPKYSAYSGINVGYPCFNIQHFDP